MVLCESSQLRSHAVRDGPPIQLLAALVYQAIPVTLLNQRPPPLRAIGIACAISSLSSAAFANRLPLTAPVLSALINCTTTPLFITRYLLSCDGLNCSYVIDRLS